MEPTLLLARVFGVYFIIASFMVFMNRKALILSAEAMFKERFAQLVAAMLSILGGLLFINLYQDWSTLASGIISTIAWLIFIKGLLYAFAPEARLVKLFKGFTEGNWYTMDGVLALILGIYLSGIGYGMW